MNSAIFEQVLQFEAADREYPKAVDVNINEAADAVPEYVAGILNVKDPVMIPSGAVGSGNPVAPNWNIWLPV
jgi:hypothetical protein